MPTAKPFKLEVKGDLAERVDLFISYASNYYKGRLTRPQAVRLLLDCGLRRQSDVIKKLRAESGKSS